MDGRSSVMKGTNGRYRQLCTYSFGWDGMGCLV